MAPLRIYADFNGLVRGPRNSRRTAVVLDTYGSLQDLCNAGVVLTEGLPLIAFDWSDDSEDLEGHGTAQYDSTEGWWVVEFDEAGVRNVPAKDRATQAAFRCVACAVDLMGQFHGHFPQPDERCLKCGTLVRTPFLPPERRDG